MAAASAAPCAAAAPTWWANSEITSVMNTASTLNNRRIEIELPTRLSHSVYALHVLVPDVHVPPTALHKFSVLIFEYSTVPSV